MIVGIYSCNHSNTQSQLNISIIEIELRSPLQLEGTNIQNIHRLYNYNDF
jgi:hypothetical protein